MKHTHRPLSPAEWEELSAYADGALPPPAQRAVEARLASDPAWQAAWAELRALKTGLAHLPPPRRPRDFTLAPEEVRSQARSRRWPWAWAGLAAAAVGLLAWLVVGAGLGRLGEPARKAAAPPPTTLALSLPGGEKAGPAMPQAAPAARPPRAEALEAAALPAEDGRAATPSPTARPPVGPTPPEARDARPVPAEPFPQTRLLWLAGAAGGLALLWWLRRRRGPGR